MIITAAVFLPAGTFILTRRVSIKHQCLCDRGTNLAVNDARRSRTFMSAYDTTSHPFAFIRIPSRVSSSSSRAFDNESASLIFRTLRAATPLVVNSSRRSASLRFAYDGRPCWARLSARVARACDLVSRVVMRFSMWYCSGASCPHLCGHNMLQSGETFLWHRQTRTLKKRNGAGI